MPGVGSGGPGRFMYTVSIICFWNSMDCGIYYLHRNSQTEYFGRNYIMNTATTTGREDRILSLV
jgi:hypothetical protein